MIEAIDFMTILPIWQQELWPGRESTIEPLSAIDVDSGYNMKLMEAEPFFWGAFSNSRQLIGVVSGFQTSDTHFRSRGLWVAKDQRNQGLGKQLIQTVEKQAVRRQCHILWTMPRQSSWEFYRRVGFQVLKEISQFEFGPHYIATKKLKLP